MLTHHSDDIPTRLETLRDYMFWQILALARMGEWQSVINRLGSYSRHLCQQPYTPSHGEVMRLAYKLLSERHPWRFKIFKERWEATTDCFHPDVAALYNDLNLRFEFEYKPTTTCQSDSCHTVKAVILIDPTGRPTAVIAANRRRYALCPTTITDNLNHGQTVLVMTPKDDSTEVVIADVDPGYSKWYGMSRALAVVTEINRREGWYRFANHPNRLAGKGYDSQDLLPPVGALIRIIYYINREHDFSYNTIAVYWEPSCAKYSEIVCDITGHFVTNKDNGKIVFETTDNETDIGGKIKISQHLLNRPLPEGNVTVRAIMTDEDEWQVVCLTDELITGRINERER